MKTAKKNKIYGLRPVIEAIDSGKQIEKVFLKKGLNNDLFRDLFQKIRMAGIPFQYVPVEKLNRLTSANHQGAVAFISEIEYQDIEKLVPGLFESGKAPFILVLDGITDVRNFGSIARTAECAGVDAIVIPSKKTAQINADAIKTSAGALNTIAVCRAANLQETVKLLKNSGLTILGASEKGTTDYFMADLKNPLAIVMGDEYKGISKEIIELCNEAIKIPLQGKIESLNVAVSTGIFCFEVIRQRSL
jgi:23S rRNA (guanosine2251-2'-O)-methyltransferase